MISTQSYDLPVLWIFSQCFDLPQEPGNPSEVTDLTDMWPQNRFIHSWKLVPAPSLFKRGGPVYDPILGSHVLPLMGCQSPEEGQSIDQNSKYVKTLCWDHGLNSIIIIFTNIKWTFILILIYVMNTILTVMEEYNEIIFIHNYIQ